MNCMVWNKDDIRVMIKENPLPKHNLDPADMIRAARERFNVAIAKKRY